MHTPAFSIRDYSDPYFSEVFFYSLTKPSRFPIALEHPNPDGHSFTVELQEELAPIPAIPPTAGLIWPQGPGFLFSIRQKCGSTMRGLGSAFC